MAITRPLPHPPHSQQETARLIAYAVNPDKTEECLFVSGLGCEPSVQAADDFEETRKQFGKQNGVYAYHYVQSFAPGEVTPELAHKIGKQLAEEVFLARGYQVLVSTHLDRKHLHNHFVVCSVNVQDGHKLNPDRKFNYVILREANDRLCRAHRLSVIDDPKNTGCSYAEWIAKKNGKPTKRGYIREDIDAVLPQVRSFRELLEALQKMGYDIGRRGKYLWIAPTGSDVHFRFGKLGKGYTEEDLTERILLPSRVPVQATTYTPTPPRPQIRYRYKGRFPFPWHGGIRGQYYRYLYILRRITRSPSVQRVRYPRAAREDALKAKNFAAELRLLTDRNINTRADLLQVYDDLTQELRSLYTERATLRSSLAACKTPQDEMRIASQIRKINERAKPLQADKAACERIYARMVAAAEKKGGNRDKHPKSKEQNQIQKPNGTLKEGDINVSRS